MEPARDQVFIGCSSQDEGWRERLRIVLKPLEESGALEVWDKTEIATGAHRPTAIGEAIGRACVAVLLVSPDFLASDAIAAREMPHLFAAQKRGELRIVWVLIRASLWKDTPFADYQGAWDTQTPLATLKKAQQDAALVRVSEEVRKAYQEMRAAQKSGAAPVNIAPVNVAPVNIAPVNTADAGPAGHLALDAALAARPLPELVLELETMIIEKAREAADDVKRGAMIAAIDALVTNVKQRSRVKEGDVVAGARLVKIIGNGNFGTIYISRRERDGALVATKVFHLDKLTEGMMLWSFRRSIKAMRHLNAEKSVPASIVKIHDAAESTLAFTMDYHDGGNLEDIGKRGWTLPKKMDVFAEVCRSVQFAHEKGVIHRDIKPANVVLDAQQRPVLTDFDISDIKYLTKLSVAKGSLGTPVFAAPEQLEDGDNATERSDVYSLGRLLYYMLLERSPGYEIEADPSLGNLSDYPGALVAIVRKATQYNPAKRYGSVAEMIADVEGYGSRAAAIRARGKAAARWVRQSLAMLIIFTLIVAGAVGFAVYQKGVAAEAKRQQQKTELERKRADELSVKLKELLAEHDRLVASAAELEKQQGSLNDRRAHLEQQIELIDEERGKAAKGSPRLAELVAQRMKAQGELEKAVRQQADFNQQLVGLRNRLERVKAEAKAAGAPRPLSIAPKAPAPSLAEGPSPVDPAPLIATDPVVTAAPDMARVHHPGPYGPKMVRIAAGEFMMGSPEGEEGRFQNELLHRVKITEDFLLAESEVTQEQYFAVMDQTPSSDKCTNCPVNEVSWFDAVAYCNALSLEEGLGEKSQCYEMNGKNVRWRIACKGYRLPTEAEWEYAARAGVESKPYGSTDDPKEVCGMGNVRDEGTHPITKDSLVFPCSDGRAGLASVRHYAANRLHVYDMIGNVWEWVWDLYGNYDSSGARNPSGPSTGDDRVIRGGSWYSVPQNARMAFRERDPPGNSHDNVGFRVARSFPSSL